MSDASEAEAGFIHFTPRAPEPVNGSDPTLRRDHGETGRGSLPPEALGGWPASPSPIGPRSTPRSVSGHVRPARNAPSVSSRPAPHGAVPPPPAPTERRDMRSAYQDDWLNAARKAKTPLELIFTNGSALSGHLVNFDTYALLMEHEGGTALVFKHAVMLVRPQSPEAEAGGGSAQAESPAESP